MKIESSQNRDIDFINAIWQFFLITGFFYDPFIDFTRQSLFSSFFSNLEIELNQT